MVRASALQGSKPGACDGDIGRVKDFYFDDYKWAMRYLVADTGVLAAPAKGDNHATTLREYEEQLHRHYEEDPPYWKRPMEMVSSR